MFLIRSLPPLYFSTYIYHPDGHVVFLGVDSIASVLHSSLLESFGARAVSSILGLATRHGGCPLVRLGASYASVLRFYIFGRLLLLFYFQVGSEGYKEV